MKRPFTLLTIVWLAFLLPCQANEIHDAVLNRDLAAVERVLKKDPGQLNKRLFPDCKTPLHLAISIGDPAIVRRLLAAKADLTIPDADGNPPLVRAAFIAGDDVFTASASLRLILGGAGDDFSDQGIGNVIQSLRKPPDAERQARLAVLASLLATKPEMNTGFPKDVTPLHVAVLMNDVDAVGLILKAGGHANVEDASWNTPLHYAALRGANRALIDMLIAQGAKIEATNKAGHNPLMYAQQLGRIETIEALIAHGARMDAEDYDSVSIIGHAAAFGHDEVVRMLYAKGGRALIRRADPSALFQAAARGNNLALAEILLSEGIDLNVRDTNGFTPLLTAVEWDRRELVRFLLGKGADRQAKTNDGRGLFRLACGSGNAALVKELIAAGAKVDGDAFVEAAGSGRVEIVELLLAHGVEVNATDARGFTALNAAIWARASHLTDWIRLQSSSGVASEDDYAKVVELLLDRGAKVDVAAELDLTPMNGAARHCGPRVLKALLKAGGNPLREAEHPIKMTPIQAAAVDGCGETVQLLLKAGADPRKPLKDGQLPLHLAANMGNAEALKVLLSEGLSLEAKSPSNGATALHMAAFQNSLECVRLLLAAGADPNAKAADGATPIFLATAVKIGVNHAESAPEDRRNRNLLRVKDLRARLSIIQLLLEHGAKTDVFPNDYQSLAHFARYNGTPETVELLENPPSKRKRPANP